MIETIKIIFTCIVIATTIIGFIITITKSKSREEAKNKIIKFDEIIQKLPGIITGVEQAIGSGNGFIKKIIALNQCQIECNNAGLEFKEDVFSEKIEEILKTPQRKENEDVEKKSNE